jgi:hypothetical protein
LAEVDVTVADLEAALPRLTLTANYGERTSSGSKTAPVPVNVAALDAKHGLHKWLMDSALRLGEPLIGRDGQRPRSAKSLASHLICHLPLIETNGWADAWAGELRSLLNECGNVTRVAERKVFAGTCAQCSTDLYAIKGHDQARCRTCGETYEVAAWRAHAATAKEYHIGTPSELSRALTSPAWGIEVSVNQICMWAKRGKLQRANEETDEAGNALKPTYRLKDVLDLNAKRKPIDGTAA